MNKKILLISFMGICHAPDLKSTQLKILPTLSAELALSISDMITLNDNSSVYEYIRFASYSSEQGYKQLAIETLERAINKFTHHHDLIDLSLGAHKLGFSDLSSQVLNQASIAMISIGEPIGNLIELAHDMKDIDLINEIFSRVIGMNKSETDQISPVFYSIYMNLANSAIKTGYIAWANRALEKAFDLTTRTAAFISIAKSAYKTKNRQLALKALIQAKRFDQNNKWKSLILETANNLKIPSNLILDS